LLQHRKCQLHQRGNRPFFYSAGSDLSYLSKNAGILFCRKETYIKLSAAGEVVTTREKRPHKEIPQRQEMPDRPFLSALCRILR